MITSNWQQKSKESFSIIDGIKVFGRQLGIQTNGFLYSRIFICIIYLLCFEKGFSLNFNLVLASSTPLTVGIPAVIFKK